jgi:hypothetical protein
MKNCPHVDVVKKEVKKVVPKKATPKKPKETLLED